ncbi:MAG: HAD family hydrolase [Muribaculaceae bacterium]|nr:HAD family hydrolase [Muribaculaceae bacterium]
MSKVQNLIFDFDGTLADTSKLIVATMQKSIEELGLPTRTEDEIKATIGIRLEEIPSYLWPDIDGLGEKVAAVYRRNFELLKDKISVELFHGVKETLQNLSDKGIKMAIATSRSLHSVEQLSEQLGIRKYFDYLLGGDSVCQGKPNPESIYKILNSIGGEAEKSMMIGDMSVDIMMGKNAGTKTCGVTYGNGKSTELKKAGADFIINSFLELPGTLE